jgi:radical SAM protein with 4Fe4S-binding SPASM domain
MYIRLKEYFWPKATNKHFYLSNLKEFHLTPEPYELTKEQYQFVLNLDGSKSLSGILKTYPKSQHNVIEKFFEKLESIDAVEYNKRQKKIRRFPPPSLEPHLRGVHFELTKNCNLNCLHCYQREYFQRKGGKELSIAEIRELAKQMRELNVVDVSISGGEPFTKPDLEVILRIFEKEGIRIGNIFSNGTLINSSHIKLLQSLISRPHLIISIDGPDPESHGKMRGIFNRRDQKRIFESLIEKIVTLSQRGIVVKVNTAVYRENLNKLPQLYKLLKRLRIKMWRLAIPKLAGAYKENYSSLTPEKNAVKNAYLKLIELFLNDVELEKDRIIVPFDLRISNAFKTEMLVRPLIKYTPNTSTCEYARNRLSIKPNGDVVPCGMLVDFVIGNIRKLPLSDIWYSREMQQLKQIEIKKVKECLRCKYVWICGAGCRVNPYFKYNSLFRKDDDTCMVFSFFPQIVQLCRRRGFNVKMVRREKDSPETKIQIKGSKLFL